MLRETLILLGDSDAARAVVTRTPLRGMARRFVPGEGVGDVVRATREANREGLRVTVNFLGESVKSEEAARQAAEAYLELLSHIAAEKLQAGVSLKFTQLGQSISEAFLARTLGPVLERAARDGTFIRFDMESSAYTQRTLDAFEELWADGWRRIGVVLQAYLHRTAGDVARMIELGAPVRLCKGAYAEPAEVAFQGRDEVDRSFVSLMQALLGGGAQAAIATHDERMIDATVDFARREGVAADAFEFQMLYGVRRDLQRELVADGWRMRVYVPFGTHWYPYLMRRLAERPANMLFLAGSVIRETPLGALLPGGRSRTNGAP